MKVRLGSDKRRVSTVLAAVLAGLLAPAARAQVGPVDRTGGTGSGSAERELMAHVIDRVTYGRNEAMWARVQSLGVDRFLLWQLQPETIPEGQALLDRLAGLPPVYAGSPPAPQWDLPHLYSDFFLRATFSERQLNEVMTEFWENHFDTLVPAGNDQNGERQRNTNWLRVEKQGFRDRALGRFRDILAVSAKSPAMMYFLDNFQNRAGRGNENYARELLELHTLGVDNYYTQKDVEEVARAFTGWTITDLSSRCDVTATEDLFCYNGRAHDGEAKVILGQVFPPGGGMDEGERVLDLLAAHPGTARFLCGKLLQKLVADAPPGRLHDECASTFLATAGDIRAVLKAILFSPEFRSPANRLNKVRTPLELAVASIRNLEGDIDISRGLWDAIAVMGQPVFQNDVPTGFAEVGGEWVGTNNLIQRWKWADAFSHSTSPRYLCDPWGTLDRLGIRTPDAIVDYFLDVLVRGHASGAVERSELLAALRNGQAVFDFNSAATRSGVRDMVGLVLGFPEYEKQ